MGHFLIVSGSGGDGAAEALSAEIRRSAETQGMSARTLSPCAWIAVSGPNPPKSVAVGAWTLIGDVFNRESPRFPSVAPDDAQIYERKLMARFWGRYVGLRTAADGQVSCLLRDPSGGLDCIVWVQDKLTFIASSPPPWLVERLRPAWKIDYGRLGRTLRNPLLWSGDLCLDGPVPVKPGALQPLPLPQAPVELWRPLDHVERGQADRYSVQDAADLLKSSIDEAVRGLARTASSTLAAEVSGGLDSSIIASSLVHQNIGPVGPWLNAYGDTPKSDERTYVKALAERLDITPTTVPLTRSLLSEPLLRQISGDIRPGINALDPQQDLDWSERLLSAGATAVMTGKGGDSILVQSADLEVFVDRWLSDGWRALLSPDVPHLARLNEVSVWTMIASARRYQRHGSPLPTRDGGLLDPSLDTGFQHSWLEGAEAFGPAKTLHIAGVIENISRHGPSLQNKALDVLHPLCSQPVIEACLAIPTPIMTTGGRDRGLARYAFKSQLPDLIIQRRSKGDLTSIFGRRVLESLDFLRPWLLDGRLASNGIINREAAEMLLTRESLMWRGRYGEIIMAAAFEGWARVWEDRLSSQA